MARKRVVGMKGVNVFHMQDATGAQIEISAARLCLGKVGVAASNKRARPLQESVVGWRGSLSTSLRLDGGVRRVHRQGLLRRGVVGVDFSDTRTRPVALVNGWRSGLFLDTACGLGRATTAPSWHFETGGQG